ncbi:H+-ATPase G subunit-domain-containing protein [Bombardia bombarda]|uniref:V-type proton ATPase subunit G n=1 Tax=Bombardia bombarda TaxID=252184 RepID=A0AA39WH98_9PEZI|nr:H+-ATPase G subunit-domain-containing protein [Bombardia bombarda]
MSAQNSAGIQTLLDAEREASKIVQRDRTKRVREARDEAKEEIQAYRAQKESDYEKFVAEHTQGNRAAESAAIQQADAKIRKIIEQGKLNEGKVIKDLLRAVFDVKIDWDQSS